MNEIKTRRGAAMRIVAAVSLVGFASAWASGQSTEYKLDQSGDWVEQSRPEPGSSAAVLAQARRDMAAGRAEQAEKQLDIWIDANKRSSDPALPEAYRLRGDAHVMLRDEFEALYDYEYVVKEFPESVEYITCIEREVDVATLYVNGMRRKLFGLRILAADDVGEELLIRAQERLPGSEIAAKAGMELADYYFRKKKLDLAALAYKLFQENYPRDPAVTTAIAQEIRATVGKFRGPQYDGASLVDAGRLARRFMQFYPAAAAEENIDEALLTRLDESAAASLLTAGQWYLNQGDEAGAKLTLRRLIETHPRTNAANEALRIMEAHHWPLQAGRRRIIPQGEAEAPAAERPAAETPSDASNASNPATDAAPSENAPEHEGQGGRDAE